MKNFMVLTEAINYMEEGLCGPITRDAVAEHCHVSLSMLEKLFRYALHVGIGTYLEKRRMTQAAKDLAGGMRVTDAAMKYQYNSVEVFSRSFKRIWNVNPSEFCEKWKFTGIFPKINYQYTEGEDLAMARKHVDISEAYEYLRERRGCYVLCFDMCGLSGINAVSHNAGDLAILEMAARLDRAAAEDTLPLRIGGDEFALVTGLTDKQEAEALRARVLAENGKPILCEGKEYPISLWCGMARIPESLRYSAFFTGLHQAIEESKK